MRTIVSFNHDWLYLAEQVGADVPDDRFTRVTLPHTNVVLPYHNFDDQEYQFISTYRKRFTLPESRNGRRVFLDFDGAMLAATVTINGHTFDEHQGGFTPFSFDITDHLNDEGENLLTVHLDSRERKDIPPFGHSVDYLVFGGIYREVSLRIVEPFRIESIFVKAFDVLTETVRLDIDVRVINQTDNLKEFMLKASAANIVTTTYTHHSEALELVVQPHSETIGTLQIEISRDHCLLWTPDNSIMYEVEVYEYPWDKDSRFDFELEYIGIRQAEFREDGFYLNGERLQLRGLNRHQNYPYIGAAAPARLQRKDADIIKYELGCNIVRTSHYPQSTAFLDRCDEIGLLVFEEIPGWQNIGDDDWKALALRDVRAMIERDRNHPSIILWGVRINESWDDHAFYTATNALAHELDPTRQTGGVRFWQDSEFLEDVFTFNDFSNDIQEPQQTPHLVTEFNGHMFPTKSWDHVERRIEHAQRHLRIQDRAIGMGGVSGAIGWCAFDYNTHKEFGAGDRICYHGVMDIFRLPKYAAYAYASQVSPSERVVLQVASGWSPGDYNAGVFEPLIVLSNCDEIEVFVGDERIGKFTPDRANYPHLPHPPFNVSGTMVTLSQPYADLRVVGYVDGQAVGEHRIAADPQPKALILQPDDTELIADGIDMTRLVFKIVDSYGNPLPYAAAVVSFEIEGEGELIGDNPFPLVGGAAALFVRTTRQPGQIRMTATTPRLPLAQITILSK